MKFVVFVVFVVVFVGVLEGLCEDSCCSSGYIRQSLILSVFPCLFWGVDTSPNSSQSSKPTTSTNHLS